MLRRSLCTALCPHPPTTRRWQPWQTRDFHTTDARSDDIFSDHYDTLGIPLDASAADIKRQFYALSKRHHPDVNPDDPAAASRFVKISEAYHVLGSPEKRQRYDRDLGRAAGGSSPSHGGTRRGSYSSSGSGGPAGSRPASGLSRRRTQFRGPPPSFYRAGGWGAQGEKRSQYAYTGQSEPPPPGEDGDAEAAAAGGTGNGGFGPGQGEEHFDPDIPYWNRAGHRRTHDGLQGRRSGASAEKVRREWEAVVEGQGGMLFNFIVVTSIVVGVTAASAWLWERRTAKKSTLRQDREGSRAN